MKRGEVRPGSAWALVTGAGSGIGRCYALQLAALGYRLVIVGNNPAPLEAVAEEIRSTAAGRPSAGGKIRAAAQPNTGDMNAGDAAAEDTAAEDAAAGEGTLRRTAGSGGETTTGTPAKTTKNHTARPEVRVIPTDLARVGAAQELYDRIAAEGIGIDVVINNAGIFSFCDILTTPAERIERIVLLHDLTVSQLCRLYAADMVRRGVRGHILNMSSYSLWMPFPGLALYSASKAYMRSFSVAFAKEVRDRGIRVTAVCPAGVATDLYGLTPRWQRIGKRLGVLITPDSCARRGLRALWRGRRCIVPDWWNRAWIPLCKVLPMWVLRPIRRFTMKFQK
ncbi:MAG: SDR family NAD(P)-dependent oxidoreductase [Alistipes sp.]|uniref:SDR family NAD(P)-dependent oxidoreductase n=1 Tax=Alistipes sp. TaxID=1872444 RepID=UPI0025BEABCC|nr:SDR family NAD(P)-dependent oxidoreductase [Alistipes sp.]MCD8275704.1 SDR family NAD(P)-dependent oxidoreductase [Alistipes sp.]